MKITHSRLLQSLTSAAIALLALNDHACAADAPQWEYVIVTSAPAGVQLSDPALDRDPVTGALQVAYAQGNAGAMSPNYLDTGVFLATIGGITKTIAKGGDLIACAAGLRFAFIFSSSSALIPNPVVSLSAGLVAFQAQNNQQGDSTFGTPYGIYVGDGISAPRCIADVTTNIPGAVGGSVFHVLSTPSLANGHVVFAGGPNSTYTGMYGDFGAGLVVLTDSESLVTGVRPERFDLFGLYPSVSPTYFGHDVAAFRADGLFSGTRVSGIFGVDVTGGTPTGLEQYVNSVDAVLFNSADFKSPSIDFGGAVAFNDAPDRASPSDVRGIYAGRLSLNLIANNMTGVPGAPGTFFSGLGAFPSIDTTPRQLGVETREHAIGFSAAQGVFLAHMPNANDNSPSTIDTVIDLPALGRLLSPSIPFNNDAFELLSINLFHQAVKDGAVAFRVAGTLGGAFGTFRESIVLARKTTPTLTVLPDVDTYVRADLNIRRNDNYGMQDFIEVGTGRADTGQSEGAADKMRAFLHFNVAMLPPLDLNSAVLNTTLHSYDNGLPDSVYTVDAHAILVPWVDHKGEGNGFEGPRPPGAAAVLTDPDNAYGLAWAGQDVNSDPGAANNPSAPGFDPLVLSTQTVRQQSNVAGDAFDWDLTTLARSWLSRVASSPNYGIALTDATGDVFRGLRFGSREGEHYALPGAVRGPRLSLKWNVGVRPGDLSGDNCVDRDDLAILMAVLRAQAIAGESLAPMLDLNGDGKVDIADARTLATLFSRPLGAPCQ